MNTREIIDLMTVCLARSVSPGDFIGVGLGTPIALVAAILARQIHGDIHVLAGGAFDVEGTADVWLGSRDATRGKAVGYVSHFDSMEMAERQTMTVQFVRPAQIDSQGNLNTSRIGARSAPEVRFPGGLATADVPSILPRVIAYHPKHRVRNLPERVSFITGAGSPDPSRRYPSAGVVTVVTDLGIVDFNDGSAELRSVHPWSSRSEVCDNTGFALGGDEPVEVTQRMSSSEASALAIVDPDRLRDEELSGRDVRK